MFTNTAGTSTTNAATLTVTPVTVDPEPNPQPDFTPEPPADSEDGLPAELEGEVTITQNGNTAIVTVPDAEEGEWFFVYAYSDPTPLGWHQADAAGSFAVDLSSLSAGVHTLAVLDANGQLVGWAPVTVAATGAQPGGDQPGSGSNGSGLPVTGSEAMMPLAAFGAIALLALGALIAGAAGRRRTARAE